MTGLGESDIILLLLDANKFRCSIGSNMRPRDCPNLPVSTRTTSTRLADMRHWTSALVLLIVCIMVWSCFGCNRMFDTSKGLGIHQKSCKEHTSTTRRILLKHAQTQERPGSSKFARRDNLADAGIDGNDCLNSSSIVRTPTGCISVSPCIPGCRGWFGP